MLSYVDRIQMVVPDREAAVERWGALFGAEVVGEDGSRHLNAHRTTVQAGLPGGIRVEIEAVARLSGAS